MAKCKLVLALFLALMVAAPALAQDPANVQRKKLREEGRVFSVVLQPNSLYVVDPWGSADFDSTVKVVARTRNCISERSDIYSWYLSFQSQFRSSSVANCKLRARVTEIENARWMTFIRVQETIEITLSTGWTQVDLTAGSYAVNRSADKALAIEIDSSSTSANCSAANDGPRFTGIGHSVNRHHNTSTAGEFRYGIANFQSWFRNLPNSCSMNVRLLIGSAGDKLKLLKLSNQQIHPKN